MLVSVMLGIDLIATGLLGFDDRVVAISRNAVLPGLGFVEVSASLALIFAALTVLSVVAWLRWGADWCVAAVWVGAIALAFTVPANHAHPAAEVHPQAQAIGDVTQLVQAGHEFTVVLVLIAILSRARVAFTGLPVIRTIEQRRRTTPSDQATALRDSGPIERCQAASIAALATDSVDRRSRIGSAAAVDGPDVLKRAARIATLARWRPRGDPLCRDNAAVLAALSLTGRGTHSRLAAFRTGARSSPYGVPASEPTWIRLLDGTLAAMALETLGETNSVQRWRETLATELRLRRGHRQGSIHVPTGITLGVALPWEHCAATALARWRGWIGDDDWSALRKPCLGAAAGGAQRAEATRLVAGGRIWAHLSGDAAAMRILQRPSRSNDPVAVALDALLDRISEEESHAGDARPARPGGVGTGRQPHTPGVALGW